MKSLLQVPIQIVLWWLEWAHYFKDHGIYLFHAKIMVVSFILFQPLNSFGASLVLGLKRDKVKILFIFSLTICPLQIKHQ